MCLPLTLPLNLNSHWLCALMEDGRRVLRIGGVVVPCFHFYIQTVKAHLFMWSDWLTDLSPPEKLNIEHLNMLVETMEPMERTGPQCISRLPHAKSMRSVSNGGSVNKGSCQKVTLAISSSTSHMDLHVFTSASGYIFVYTFIAIFYNMMS